MTDLTALELIAGALILFTAIKLAVVAVSLPAWLQFARKIYVRPTVTSTVAAVLAGAVLIALVNAGVTIVQILAVTVFVILLLLIGFAPFGDELITWAEGQDLKTWIREQWLYTLIWIALLGWGLYEILLTG